MVGVDIFTHLVLAKMEGRKVNISEKTLMENEFDERFWPTARSMCQGIVDLSYKPSGVDREDNSSKSSGSMRMSRSPEQFLKVNKSKSVCFLAVLVVKYGILINVIKAFLTL